jgi:hypothetical protein
MSQGVKLDSTRSGTWYLPANSTERICRTLEPMEAISSISSKLTVLQAARLGHHARVGGVDAVHVGVDQAFGAFSAAATATAEVSLPPRPSVVMLPPSSTPWKPVMMTTLPAARSARTRTSSIDSMRALV